MKINRSGNQEGNAARFREISDISPDSPIPIGIHLIEGDTDPAPAIENRQFVDCFLLRP